LHDITNNNAKSKIVADSSVGDKKQHTISTRPTAHKMNEDTHHMFRMNSLKCSK